MFKNNYQGGAVVEIFSGQGKDPVAKWKLCGGPSAIHKEYNKEVKGFVYCLEGSSQTTKMQMPENGKMSLGLLQRFLVLQVNIPQIKDFSIELVITDLTHLKRRLYLSTVHKELSATLWHAKIPLVGLKRNIWSTLCVDLVSFTGELFKDTGFLTLDGITLFATCKVRRIFTMRTEPTGMSEDEMFLSGAGLMDSIPRSCQFPADVNHVTQVLNIENLRKGNMRNGRRNSDCVADQCATARSTSYRKTRPQGLLSTASGSRGLGAPPQTGRKSSAASDGMDRALCFQDMGSLSSKTDQNVTAECQSTACLTEKLSNGEPSHFLREGTPHSFQPHPPKERVFDKQRPKKLRVCSSGRERQEPPAPPDATSGGRSQRSATRERPPPSRQESVQQPLTLTGSTQHQTADECHFSAREKGCEDADAAAETLFSSIQWGSSPDPQVWSNLESNEESEPQLTLPEEVFTFSSQPHSPKRGQGQSDQEKTEMGEYKVQSRSGRRYEAQPEDDFIGSESDEEKGYTTCQHQGTSVDSSPATLTSPDLTLKVQLEVQPDYLNMDQTSAEELSQSTTSIHTQPPSSRGDKPSRQDRTGGPCGPEVVSQVLDGTSSVSLSRRLLQEVKIDNSRQHKEKDEKILEPVDHSARVLNLVSGLQMHGDDDDDEEEFRMLASLKREQEEDECRASGFSASQIHQCNVSISMSSDDASTWTHISMPSNQGHHYQQEMNPLLCSNPREWMDVLSPPIMPPSRRRRSNNTGNHLEDLIGGEDESANEEENEYLNLLYDPCLNCYFDPQTGKYCELA